MPSTPTIKARVYASAHVAVYVVVDVAARELILHTDPSGDAYRTARRLNPQDALELPAGAGTLRVADIVTVR